MTYDRKLILFFVLFSTHSFAANLVHPVTPAFIESINAPSNVFGIAFASMAAGQFFFSPFIGKCCDKFGDVVCMTIGSIVYGISPIIFYMATDYKLVVVGRFLGGVGVAGVMIGSMAYIANLDIIPEYKNKLLVIYAAVQSIIGPLGYLGGGLVGDYALAYSFYLMAGMLTVNGVFIFICLRKTNHIVKADEKFTFKESNPFSSIISSAKLLNVTVSIFLISVLISMISTSGFDQNFNYFLRINLNYDPSDSGFFKAGVGAVSLLVNMTINLWVVKRTNVSKSLCIVQILAGLAMLGIVFSSSEIPLIVFAFIYYATYAMYLPLQQTVVIKNGKNVSSGAVMALYTSAKAGGMVIGPLFAGFMFDINPNYAFITFALCLILASVLAYINYIRLRKEGIE